MSIITGIAKHLAKAANTSPTKIICGIVISAATSIAANTISNSIMLHHTVSQTKAAMDDIVDAAVRTADGKTEKEADDIEVTVDVVEENN